MRYTLLELTQLILSSMDGDEISAIADTVESVQVTTLLKNVFYDMATELDLPEHETLFELVASGDSEKPTLMTLPSDVTKMAWIKYDKKDADDTYNDWTTVDFMPLQTFIDMQNSLAGSANSSRSTVTATAGATDTINWTAHGLSNNRILNFTTTGTLPDPLVIATDYYVINKTADTFQISTTLAGTAVDLTDTGSGTHTAFTVLSNIGIMNVTGNSDETHEFNYRDDVMPDFFTTFDDHQLIFNSYDKSIDSTLQASKTMCSGAVYPIFTISDSFAPDLDPTQFAYFIQKAKVRAHFELRQLPHAEAANEARRQQIALQRQKRRTSKLTGLEQTVRYGR